MGGRDNWQKGREGGRRPRGGKGCSQLVCTEANKYISRKLMAAGTSALVFFEQGNQSHHFPINLFNAREHNQAHIHPFLQSSPVLCRVEVMHLILPEKSPSFCSCSTKRSRHKSSVAYILKIILTELKKSAGNFAVG